MARPKNFAPDHSRVVGYIRVSTTEQADSGLGLEAQRTAIAAECDRRGWTLVGIHEDAGVSGKNTARPGFTLALDDLKTGVAGTLMASKLDRVSRSLRDSADLMEQAKDNGWNLAILDLAADLSTPAGEFLGGVMASAAQWERRLIGQRTKDAMAVRKAQGAHVGRASTLPAATVRRIVKARAAGKGWTAIAKELNADEVRTGQGGSQWYPATVRKIALAHG